MSESVCSSDPVADFRSLLIRKSLVSVGAFALCLSTACAGHSAKTLKARDALDKNEPATALKLLNQELKVKHPNEIPHKEKKATALIVLDRSTISQSLSDYKSSSSDLEYADKKIEMFDMSRTTVDDIGKYVFSDDVGPYQAPPYEKVMVNTVNMQNYLARHDLNGARVEARRLAILQKYLADSKNPALALNAPGSYLAGFVFERSGRPDIALRYYDEALEHVEFQSLVEPVQRLSQLDSYSSPRLKEFLARHPSTPAADTATPAADTATPADQNAEWGEVLVLLNYGRIPAKVAKRIPIGLALTYATLFMSAASVATTNQLAAQGLVTWINYPDLEKSQRTLSVPQISMDDQPVVVEGAGALDLAARAVYEAEKGKVIAAGITRLIARVAVGVAAGSAARAASGDNVVGALVSLGTQATLTALDTPDTRSWATLPARMAVARLRLPPGKHTLKLNVQGSVRTETFELEPGGWNAVVLTILR